MPGSGSATSYAYKASLIGPAHRFELTEEGLSWQIAGRSGLCAGGIARVVPPFEGTDHDRTRERFARVRGGRGFLGRIVHGARLRPPQVNSS